LFGEKRYLSPILDLCNGEIIAYKVMKRPVYKLVGDILSLIIFLSHFISKRRNCNENRGWLCHQRITN
ncbi:hypothetical protein ABS315_24575, partial [Peribacillus frigoritolerans]